MKRPKCACLHPDATACYEARYPGVNFLVEDDDFRDVERCDCCCHSEDEDGFSEWDDSDNEVLED